ncbi:MAG: hypothetical protein AB8F95_09140 [Bacteroidia bacterium]
MKKFKRISITYFILASLFTGINCYLDFHHLDSGWRFHQLSSTERNTVRVNGILSFITNPAQILAYPFIEDQKFRKRKAFKYSILMFLTLIPSYLFYVRYFGMWPKLKEAFGIKDRKQDEITELIDEFGAEIRKTES